MRTVPLLFALSLAVGAALPGATAARADEASGRALTIDSLMARFRTMPGLSGKFREEKRIALLAKPLASEGTIHFAPPGLLARHTLSPGVSSVVLDQGTLRFGDGKTEEKVDLGKNPAVRAFVESFLQVLSGDRVALERAFAIDLVSSAPDKWEIALKPKAAPLSQAIRRMTFEGDATSVTRMRITETSGDEAVTTFTAVDTKKRYSAAEIREVFRLPRK